MDQVWQYQVFHIHYVIFYSHLLKHFLKKLYILKTYLKVITINLSVCVCVSIPQN